VALISFSVALSQIAAYDARSQTTASRGGPIYMMHKMTTQCAVKLLTHLAFQELNSRFQGLLFFTRTLQMHQS